jgi:hypothetical protein
LPPAGWRWLNARRKVKQLLDPILSAKTGCSPIDTGAGSYRIYSKASSTDGLAAPPFSSNRDPPQANNKQTTSKQQAILEA